MKHTKAFTLIEVLVCIAIAAIILAMIVPAIQRYKAHKQCVKLEQETKPAERFILSMQRTPAGYPDLILIHDNITGSDVLYLKPGTGNGAAVVLPRQGFYVTNYPPATP